MPREIPSEAEVLGYFERCSNWGRWGPDDQLGTINYITPAKRKQGAGLVREGVSVTCARPIAPELAPDVYSPPLHYMTSSGERWAGKKSQPNELQSSADFIGLQFHGLSVTHIDSLAHIFRDGKMYNDQPSDRVTTSEGATVGSIDLLRDGVVTRGVLLDLPRAQGIKWISEADGQFPHHLEEAERSCKVHVESGDALLVRTGALRRRNEEGPRNLRAARPGFHGACVPWFHEREVALLGSDTAQDMTPSGYPQVPMPVHQVGIVAMGLWLMDNANLEELAAACERYQRWEFMLTIGPLRVVNGTGSPVNPIAIF